MGSAFQAPVPLQESQVWKGINESMRRTKRAIPPTIRVFVVREDERI